MSDSTEADTREEETPSILDEEPETEVAAAADGTGGGALESLLDGLDEAGARRSRSRTSCTPSSIARSVRWSA